VTVVAAAPNAGSLCDVNRVGGRVGRHYAWLRVGGPASDFCARVRSGRGGLTREPGTMRSFREPSIWRIWAPISVCGPTARMERSLDRLLELAGGPAPCQISILEPA
jgi:hypothetical protein